CPALKVKTLWAPLVSRNRSAAKVPPLNMKLPRRTSRGALAAPFVTFIWALTRAAELLLEEALLPIRSALANTVAPLLTMRLLAGPLLPTTSRTELDQTEPGPPMIALLLLEVATTPSEATASVTKPPLVSS